MTAYDIQTSVPDYYLLGIGGYLSSVGVYSSYIHGQPETFFNGTIDDVMIYNRVLSDEETMTQYTYPPP